MKPNRNETERQQKRAENALFDAIVTLQSAKECRLFFKDLCLQQELPYRKIHDLTGVSVTTIGRVARCLSDGSGGYQTAIDRLPH